ncbi:hypothetical protein IMZ31_24385 (plasmid) [Pontibacillus sp. ALD_SL1]|uniref:hypothetical protein n=1 Tax=Pontibacillus sp. ALD_SL1 TaxID=2777185 RepID=UPI001A9672C2|nr:hypothetical protein [Pontibacillus sp. ALD_SL1]QST02592.1 hypothetical protein IMZ31_24385 [Pontibacillus sp. ALD_SL1]
MLACPYNHEISHVLVCGGESETEGGNVYFQMTVKGDYTDRLADGSVGVTEEMENHADGGCCTEPICPVCGEECIEKQE